ncbi:MAG: hypothetical protein IPK76_22050 [Lewinellaceae bacterium]|nr:hypothetical protein [Lewinellaceae bacterium]
MVSIVIIVVAIALLITVLITPILLRKIIDYMPPDMFASLSLSNLNQSEVLTFVAIECWEMCNKFTEKIKIENDIKYLVKAGDEKEFTREFNGKKKNKEGWIDAFKTLNGAAIQFKAEEYKKIENAKALKMKQ